MYFCAVHCDIVAAAMHSFGFALMQLQCLYTAITHQTLKPKFVLTIKFHNVSFSITVLRFAL